MTKGIFFFLKGQKG